MKKIQKHIEIVRSTTSGLSSMSQKSCEAISAVLVKHYDKVGVTTVNNMYDLKLLVAKQPDLVFLGMKNIPLRAGLEQHSVAKVWLSVYLEKNGLSYTGSTGKAIELDFDKPTAKKTVEAAGLSTSAYFLARPGQYRSTHELPLGFPLFIKPPNSGGGKGIGADSVVRNFADFERKVQSIADYFRTPALVEPYLPGREFSVAILENINSDELLAMPIELITEQNDQGDRILGKSVKAADTERTINVRDTNIKKSIVELAVSVFKVLGARDYGRIDIRLDEQGIPHFLEANLMPGLGDGYYTRACWINLAFDYETMIIKIAELGLSRNLDINEAVTGFPAINNTTLPSLETVFESAKT